MQLNLCIQFFLQLVMMGQAAQSSDILGLGRLTTTLTGGIQSEVIRSFIELFRKGLITAKMGNMSVPNIEWDVECSYMHTSIKSRDARILGLTNFNVRNASKLRGLTQMDMVLDLEFPKVQIIGSHQADGKFLGIIPVVGSGQYSVKLHKVEVRGRGQLKLTNFGTAAKIDILDPFVAVNGISAKFEGFPSSLYYTSAMCILLFSLIIYTVLVIFLSIVINGKMNSKSSMKKSSKDHPMHLLQTQD